MSYSTLYTFDSKGDISDHKDYRNGNIFAIPLWGYLGKKYLGWRSSFSDSVMVMPPIGEKSEMDKLWALLKAPEVVREDKLAFGLTLDLAVYRPAELEELANALQKIAVDMSQGQPHIAVRCYEIGRDIQDIWYMFKSAPPPHEALETATPHVGFCCTSVCDPWEDLPQRDWEEDLEELDEREPYNIYRDKLHFFPYDTITAPEVTQAFSG